MLAVITTALALLAAAACDIVLGPAPGASSTGAAASRPGLDGLAVAAPRSMAGYKRERFPHWIHQGNGCDTRDVVLQRDGKNVVSTADCKITSGTWYSVYEKKTFTDPRLIDIDHMVPLANAWRSGADVWTDEQRSEFANDLVRPALIAVSATTNRAKGDQDPSQWRPANRGFWCEYAQRWIAVKHHWKLSVTTKEKSKLVEMLETCTWPSSTAPTSATTPAA
ncbi:MAG TPA: HNH endonuclease family protein [Micromonosporaceae bacterium]|nr:HNH endonuclease family protein [Micromonosporaceae bacterium]